MLVLLAELKQELEQLAEKIDRADKSIEKIARENESCRRPGMATILEKMGHLESWQTITSKCVFQTTLVFNGLGFLVPAKIPIY